jgi:hypothetical protein
MALPKYKNKRIRNGWRGISFGELALTLCVILGLLFVSMRIMAMGFPVSSMPTGTSGTIVVKAEPALGTLAPPVLEIR